ncbi:type IV pilus assembly protein FimV [Acinetobacter sp. 161(2023)]|uniref:type IV pilus assembly protein FimV n=1 Tax=Acinetobacter sp. 161(2023) TaxID=3098768 RepID=UPI003009AE79
MTVYNKLKIAIFTIMSSPSVYAITLDPIQIQSAPGDLLYAEMNFQQADPNSTLQVSLATPEDLSALGVTHQPPGNLNFYTRQNGQGSGVIVITSSRPVINPELNIVVKISEGSATRLQHIKTVIKPSSIKKTESTLSPQFVVNEKDIALNLPESTQYASSTSAPTPTNSNSEQNLNINSGPAPAINTNSSTQLRENSSAQVAQQVATSTTPDQAATKNQSKSAINKSDVNNSPKTTVKNLTAQNKSAPPKSLEQNSAKKQILSPSRGPVTSGKYVVQHNESLWSIANRIAAKTKQPVAKVMHDIQQQNQHAFIQGDVNRLRQGIALKLTHTPTAKTQQNKSKTEIMHTAKSPSGKAKYRLQQAEMSIVAENSQNSTHGSAKNSTQQSQNNTELAVKVMTKREKTVTLQKNVTKLNQTLRLKDQRIQLLNARLAELQQQLQAQQRTHKQKH